MENLDNKEYVENLQTLEDSDVIKQKVDNLIKFCMIKENRDLKKQNIDAYKQKCMVEFMDIHGKYPTLFFQIIENPTTFPKYRLNEMLSLKKKIESEETTNERASVQLGQKYYDEFVKDTVAKLDSQIDTKK